MTAQDFAQRAYHEYEERTRDDGTRYLAARDGVSRPLLLDLDILDDREGCWAHDALDQIANITTDLDGATAEDLFDEVTSGGWEPADVYTYDLWTWARDHRADVDDAIEEWGYPEPGAPIEHLFMTAQQMVAERVLMSVCQWVIEGLEGDGGDAADGVELAG